VKFERRRRILRAISHLPITVIGDQTPDIGISQGKLRFQTSRTFDHLLHLMADSRAVICPTPHMTGFHERVLGAMSAGSAVLSSPNHLLQSQFVDGKELLFFKDEASLVRVAEKVFSDPGTIERIADEGHKRSAALFSPERFVELTLSILGIDDSQLNRTHQAGNKNTTATEPARDADTVAVKSSA
jgi:spore maturation protein CgeB